MRFMSKIFSLLGIIICAALLILVAAELYLEIARVAAPNTYPTVFGYSKAIVLTDSMQPEISAGDLLIYKSQDEYGIDDIVIFYDDDVDAYVTHRIVRKHADNFYTKGDANNSEDKSPLTVDCIEGKVILKIPRFSSFISFIKTKEGLLSIGSLLAAILFLPPLIRFIFKKR